MINIDLQRAAELQRLGRWLEAAELYALLAREHPSDHRLRANQGNALWLADLPQAAAAAYRQALALQPDCAVSLRGMASCLRDLKCWPEAIAAHRRAAGQIVPGSAEHGMNLWAESQILLGEQRWPEAFAAMAARHPEAAPGRRDSLQPQLALTTEQGFGDTFQYLRFVVELVERRRQAGLHQGLDFWVEPNLENLLREGLAWLRDPPRILIAGGGRNPPADAVTLLDLPHLLGIRVVHPMGPYLQAAHWPRAQPAHPPRRVGICWAAGRKQDDPFTGREYRKRSLPPAVLWRLLDGLRQRGVEIVSLQVGADADGAAALGIPLTPPPEEIASFRGTARVLRGLDRLVSVDTAVAHLAGAMGVPAWILLPWSADPRWLAEGASTPWYGSLRLVRQPRTADWHGAMDRLFSGWDRA